VELFCYAQVLMPDATTRRFQRCIGHWRSTIGLSDEQVAAQVREDRIDILVDLKLHTSGNRLPVFARKPAPVQVTWLGYPGSTGLTTIDYRLSDPHLDPMGMDESIYSEKTVRLPHCFWCYDPLDGRDVPVNRLPAQSNGFVTFGCLNNFSKVNDSVLRLWAGLLRVVSGSRLLLLAPEGSHRQRALELLHREGISGERVEFVVPRPRRQYLEYYQRIDLGLDTLPYNGHTTSLDSLWMGVPVVTLVGETVVGRAGLCQLMNLGLPELIARTPEDYVRIATELAQDHARLAGLRATLRARMEASPLMDAPGFARDIEAAYRQMWRTWCEQPETPPCPK
jgi:predicted O-linked N-acetylglucosamine transferase (SPINDLY family)